MYQIKVNGILLPTIYWSLSEAMDAQWMLVQLKKQEVVRL